MSTVDPIVTDAQDLEIDSGIIELYEIEIGNVPTGQTANTNKLYFHPGKDLDNGTTDNDLLFGHGTDEGQQTYIALPIFMTKVEKSAEGAQPRPKLTFANVESIFKSNSLFKTQMDDGTWNAEIDGVAVTSTNFTMDDLIGARVIRRKTLEKYTGNNVTGYEFGKELFIIDRISNKSSIFIEVELSSPVDLGGTRLPRRQVVGKYCPWVYQKGLEDINKSACDWKTHEQFQDSNPDGTDAVYSFYFTVNDEPLVLLTKFPDDDYDDTDYWKGPYVSNVAYVRGNYVETGDRALFWRCERDLPLVSGNNQVPPAEGATQWQIVRTYTVWNNSTSYTVNSADVRRNSYVKHANTIWRAVTANTNVQPGLDEKVWTRGDVCGKLLKSCKIRYQGIPLGNIGGDGVPSPVVDTNNPLPFGAFPGTRKFR